MLDIIPLRLNEILPPQNLGEGVIYPNKWNSWYSISVPETYSWRLPFLETLSCLYDLYSQSGYRWMRQPTI